MHWKHFVDSKWLNSKVNKTESRQNHHYTVMTRDKQKWTLHIKRRIWIIATVTVCSHGLRFNTAGHKEHLLALSGANLRLYCRNAYLWCSLYFVTYVAHGPLSLLQANLGQLLWWQQSLLIPQPSIDFKICSGLTPVGIPSGETCLLNTC